LELKFDGLLSSFAFNFRLNAVQARVERDCIQRLKLNYDALLSNFFGFNFNLRRYNTVAELFKKTEIRGELKAGWCRLTPV